MTSRTILIGLGVVGLGLLAAGTLVVSNRDLSKHLIEAWDAHAEKTQVTLFRWGELMSLSAELKRQYGAEPEVTYDTSTRDRTLSISFSNYRVPEQATTEGHAREIAAFALGKTKKVQQIDAVRVLFQNSPRDGGPYSFTRSALTTALP